MKLKATLLAMATVVALAPALAQADEARGLEIATQWDDRNNNGFVDSKVDAEMILENRNGDQSTRKMRQMILEVPDADVGDKSLTVFDHPRDVKGTAFLSFAKILDPDDQWLYLPALKRVKRISSKNKSGPFVGSEFAYEDLSGQELGKYTYNFLREEPCGDLSCAVVEQFPTYENSGYTRTIVWYDLTEYRQQKTEFYDRKDKLLKTLEFGDFRQYLGQFWRAHDMYMVNHQTGKKTRLKFSNYEFQTDLSERDFNRNALQRIR